jgi:hypothetical protein
MPSILNFTIPKPVQVAGEEGIRKFITANKLTSPTVQQTITDTVNHASVGTVLEYHNRWEEMKKFCFLLGDYESATLLDRKLCPRNPFPLKPETISLYYQFKTGALDKPLSQFNSSEKHVDILGNVVYCRDDWHAPGPIYKFRSSLHLLHEAYDNLRGVYFPKCPDCITANDILHSNSNHIAGTYGSCLLHAGNPHIVPCGNSGKSAVCAKAHSKSISDVKTWVRKGSVQLLPGEIRQLRAHLVNSGSLSDFQMYVMIVLGIKLFLRADELLSLTVEQFDKKYQIFNDNKIKALSVWIKGKTDVVPVNLMLFKDDECSEFCPIRHLLVYLAKTGIKKGLLFPVIKSKSTVSTKAIRYEDWLNGMKRLLCNVLNREIDNGKLGTHTLRKTGYLFAIWGVLRFLGYNRENMGTNIPSVPELALANILKSARHKTIANACTYARDSATHLAMVNRERFSEQHTVSPWESIFLLAMDTAYTITSASRVFQKDIPDMAVYYVTKILFLDVTTMSINSILEFARQTVDKKTELDRLKELLVESVPDGLAKKIIALVQTVIANEVDTRRKEELEARLLTSAEPLRESPTKKARTSVGTNDIPLRLEFGKLKGAANKLAVIIEVNKSLGEIKTEGLTAQARVWYTKNVPKVVTCLEVCHGGSLASFVTGLGGKPFKSHEYKCGNCASK